MRTCLTVMCAQRQKPHLRRGLSRSMVHTHPPLMLSPVHIVDLLRTDLRSCTTHDNQHLHFQRHSTPTSSKNPQWLSELTFPPGPMILPSIVSPIEDARVRRGEAVHGIALAQRQSQQPFCPSLVIALGQLLPAAESAIRSRRFPAFAVPGDGADVAGVDRGERRYRCGGCHDCRCGPVFRIRPSVCVRSGEARSGSRDAMVKALRSICAALSCSECRCWWKHDCYKPSSTQCYCRALLNMHCEVRVNTTLRLLFQLVIAVGGKAQCTFTKGKGE